MDSASVAFTLPGFDTWYAVLSNEEHVVNAQVLRGTVGLYKRASAGVAAGDGTGEMRMALRQNSPNPFKPETWITYTVIHKTHVDLNVYDVNGRLVATLASGEVEAGDHRVAWNGRDREGRRASPGIYFYKLETPDGVCSRRMALIR